jgi:hypothetical protein
MKKIIAISMLAATLAGSSAFGQGYFAFTGGKSQAWDGFTTPGTSVADASVDVAFLWATGTPTPSVDALLTTTPHTANSTTAESYTVAQAWSDILTDPNFHLAVDATTANAGNVAVAQTLASPVGSVNYNSGFAFGVTGTTAGVTYSVFEISWNSAFATPSTASTGGSAVGWGPVFSYVPAVQTGLAPSFTEADFGTFVPAAVPEPSTMALAGLGSLAALLFRRKK